MGQQLRTANLRVKRPQKKRWPRWARRLVCLKDLSCLSKMINSHAKDGQSDLESIIKIFSKMPGLGPRSAQRLVFHLIKKREIILNQLILSLENLNNKIKYCEICGNVTLGPR